MTLSLWCLAYLAAGVVVLFGLRHSGYFDDYGTNTEAGWCGLLVMAVAPIWLLLGALLGLSTAVAYLGRWLRRAR